MHNTVVIFEWDSDKASSNYKKHGVCFADAVGVFEAVLAITIEDRERRW
ncbi:MAG: BrnT family toxin [Deltaproteobacteria bacterium]